MFAGGKRQVDVVDKLGVSAQTASRWHRILLAEDKKGLAGAAAEPVGCQSWPTSNWRRSSRHC